MLKNIILLNFSILIILSIFPSSTNSQNLCIKIKSLADITNTISKSPNVTAFIQNWPTGKCLRVENFGHFANSKLFLDECTWWNKTLKDETFILKSGGLKGNYIIQNDAGLDTKYCFTMKSGLLMNAQCQPNNFDQVWELKEISGKEGVFLIKQNSSMKCILPKEKTARPNIKIESCNSNISEQIWRICLTK